eukprot:Nk52_evm76s164 gene=Nk52_evmTU76s164
MSVLTSVDGNDILFHSQKANLPSLANHNNANATHNPTGQKATTPKQNLPDEVLLKILQFCNRDTLLNLLEYSRLERDKEAEGGDLFLFGSVAGSVVTCDSSLERFLFEATIEDVLYPEAKLINAVVSDNPVRVLRGLRKNVFFGEKETTMNSNAAAVNNYNQLLITAAAAMPSSTNASLASGSSSGALAAVNSTLLQKCEFEDDESKDILELACKKGSLQVLQWMYTHTEGFRRYYEFLASFVDDQDFEEKHHRGLHMHRPPLSDVEEEGEEEEGDDGVVMMEENGIVDEDEEFCCDFDIRLMNIAAAYGHADVVEWLNEIFPSVSSPNEAAHYQQSYHHASSCGLLRGAESAICTTDAMDYAAKNGHLALIQWLHSHRNEGCTVNAMNWAAEMGHIDVVQWLHENRDEGCNEYALRNAAGNNHLRMVQWLTANRPHDKCTTSAMDWACGRGHLDVVRWLHENRSEGCSEDAMYLAAGNGHLDVLKYIWEVDNGDNKNRQICSPYVMDNAAAHGHLDVVQWLQREGMRCTSDAIDRAASKGHLEMVQWLYANRSEGATRDAMNGAAENGHLDVLKWLHENQVSMCSSYAMDRAAANGHLDVVAWLDQVVLPSKLIKSPPSGPLCTKSAMNFAAANGHLDVCNYLRKHRREGCSKRALTEAVLNGNLESVKWLFDHYLSSIRAEYPATANHSQMANLLGDITYLAASLGHLRILAWLLTGGLVDICKPNGKASNRTEKGSSGSSRGTLPSSGGIQVVSARRVAQLSPRILRVAMQNGHVHILQWLHDHLRSDYVKAVKALEEQTKKEVEEETVSGHADAYHRRVRRFSYPDDDLQNDESSLSSGRARRPSRSFHSVRRRSSGRRRRVTSGTLSSEDDNSPMPPLVGQLDANDHPYQNSNVAEVPQENGGSSDLMDDILYHDVLKETVIVARRRSRVSSHD